VLNRHNSTPGAADDKPGKTINRPHAEFFDAHNPTDLA